MNSEDSSKSDSHKNASKKPKMECVYGEGCYRKNFEHFKKFTHSHLNDLLKGMGEKIEVPSSYKPKISYKTLIEQLEYVQQLAGCNVIVAKQASSQPSVVRNEVNSVASSSQASHTLGNQIKRSHDKNTLDEHSADNSTTVKSSPEGNKFKDQGTNPAWNAAMETYKRNAQSMMKLSVEEKIKAAAPYNIFLTTIKDARETHKEPLSISFPELLDPYFGELESSLQINFMIEFGFLLAQYSITGYKSRPLTLLYGQIDCDLGDKFKHFLTHAKIVPPSSFGSHHTKLMIFRYTNKSIRIIVSTANLVESDWENRTQGLWISPECPALPTDSDTGAGESVTNFKHDILEYLTAYRLPCLQPWLEALRMVDMSSVKVFFIGSVPGSHTLQRDQWGQLKLAKLLKENVASNNGQVIAQCSSIGSLGPKPNSWLQGEMLATLSRCKSAGVLLDNAPLKLIYPSFECISKSYDGLLGGGCLPYSQITHKKQEWLIAFLCDWYSNRRYRTRAPPHIKTYCRISKDHHQMYYFVLTSANMSKAAWGQQAKSGSLNILSYEAGVLLVPQILISKDYFPLIDDGEVKPFSLPYDLPLVPYCYSDVPWFIDNLC